MSEPVTEVVIPGESAGMHTHPHTHSEFDHDHPDIRAEIAAVQAAHTAEAISADAETAAEISADAALEAVIVAEDSKNEIEILREEMLAGFAELRSAQAVVPVASATLPGEAGTAVVEEPEPETHRKPPVKKSGSWF
jgi:hypothetical protein